MRKIKCKIEIGDVLSDIFFVLVLAVLIYIRFSWFDQHFTHYDDIKVAQLTDFNVDVFQIYFGKYKYSGGITEEIYNLFYLLFHNLYNWIFYAINFSKYWTYAPAQFVFTFALLPMAKDYNGIKFFGRFPSLVFGILSLLICWNVIKKITDNKKIALFGTCILGFSWQSILYCMHMSNYESIIFLGFLGAFLVILCIKKQETKSWILGALVLGGITWFHYQVLCLFGGFVFTYLIYSFVMKKKKNEIIINFFAIVFSYALIVLPLTFFANMNGVITWNAGVNGQFQFKLYLDIGYIVKFFILNSCRVFKAMLSPVPLELGLSNLLVGVLALFFLYGIWNSLKEIQLPSIRFWGTIFCIGTLTTEYFFVLIGKFTLSPTRHCNVLIPIYIIEICIGMYYFIVRKKTIIYNNLPILMAMIIGCSWAIYAKDVKGERVDQFTEQKVEEIIEQCSPDLVIDRSAPQIWYLLNEEYIRREIIDYQTDFYDKDEMSDNNKRILIISHTEPLNQKTIDELSNLLVEKGYLNEKDIDKFKHSKCIYKYEKWGKREFDFNNVTEGAANNLFYYLLVLK